MLVFIMQTMMMTMTVAVVVLLRFPSNKVLVTITFLAGKHR